MSFWTDRRIRYQTALGALLAVGITGLAGMACADDDSPESMAPPVSAQATAEPTGDSVFQYTEIPAGKQVPLTRAVFDQGGYQLFDTVGETIVVPFTNQNLYVMKFAVSPDGTLFFVNDNGTPTLYVPRQGYLENASVPGSKWYPFTDIFQPTEPVYLGCAPSYISFVDIGWYSGSCIYGGYYCSEPFGFGVPVVPVFGLSFYFGGGWFHGWGEFHPWLIAHEGPFHTGWYHPRVYGLGGNHGFDHPFRGAGVVGGGHGGFPVGGHGFAGGASGVHGGATVGSAGTGHYFRGTGGEYRGESYSGTGRTFTSGGGNYSRGATGYSGSGGRTFTGGNATGGGRTFSGASGSSGGGPTFGGGGNAGGGGHSFSGGGSTGGGRGNGGGDHSSGGGGGGHR